MAESRRRTRAANVLALRIALALLVFVAGLACVRSASAADSAQSRPAAHSVSLAPAHAQSGAAGDDAGDDVTVSSKRCTGYHSGPAEAPVAVRYETSAPALVAWTSASTGRPPVHDAGAAAVPGRGGPAPPAPPTLEALSVLRV